MNTNFRTFALAAAALSLASAASADLRGPGGAGAADPGALATSPHVQWRLDVSGSPLTLRIDGRRARAAEEASLPWSFDGPLPWLPVELMDGFDTLRFDRFDPRTGERTVFADASWRTFQDTRAR
jgi:hypothetical protein